MDLGVGGVRSRHDGLHLPADDDGGEPNEGLRVHVGDHRREGRAGAEDGQRVRAEDSGAMKKGQGVTPFAGGGIDGPGS